MRALVEVPPTPTATAAASRPMWRSTDERQAAARDTFRAALQQGDVLTGAELGARFGMSERWGRDRIAEVRADGTSSPTVRRRDPHDVAEGDGNATMPDQPTSCDGGTATSDGNRRGTHASPAQPVDVEDSRRDCGNGHPVPRGNGKNGDETAPSGAGNGKRSLPACRTDGNGNARVAAGGGKNGSRRPAVNGKHAPATAAPSTSSAPGEPQTSSAQQRIMTMAVVVVASVAAAASYEHQRALAELAGEGWRSLLLPFSVDGLLMTATMLMLTRRRAGQPAGALTWISLALGVAASVGANVVGADPTLADPVLVGRLVAAWPPLALFLSLELLMRHLTTHQEGHRP